jgi:Fic family protein
MNCYYSNLIEGHNTHPVDIERALRAEYSSDSHKRNLQIEAKANIAVQQWIDAGGLKGRLAVSMAGLLETHRRFYDLLPEEMLWTEDPTTGRRERVVPGELRQHDVKVGRLVAVSPGALPAS